MAKGQQAKKWFLGSLRASRGIKKNSRDSSLPLGFGYFKKEIDNKNFSKYNYLVVVNFLCSYGHQNLQEEYYDDEIYGISTNNIQITDTPIIKNNAFY